MKKILLLLFLAFSLGINAMGFNEAKEHALFLVDKLKLELTLTDEQYEKCYEIYLDYFISVNNEDDLYKENFELRNELLQNTLLDWQYEYLFNSLYFYTPIFWLDNSWFLPIYHRYPPRYVYRKPMIRPHRNHSHIRRNFSPPNRRNFSHPHHSKGRR